MDYISAIILGVVQGITEFLPVSSTGHLVLVRDFLELQSTHALALDAVLHLATMCAVLIYFSNDVWVLIQTVLRKLGRLPVNQKDLMLVYALAIGTIPAVVAGFFLESLMEDTFRSPLLVAGVLIFGSFVFIYAEWVQYQCPPQNEMTIKKGFQVGLFQVLALLPGMSRSGATIAGGMILGLSRSEAARFAFLLAIPVMLGAGSKKLLELITSPEQVSWLPIMVGSVTAFFVGLLAIHFMISFVRKYSLWPFIWYRFILAAVVIYVSLFT